MRCDVRLALGVFALGAGGFAPTLGFAQTDTEDVQTESAAGSEGLAPAAGVDGRDADAIDIEDLPPPAEEACFLSRDIDNFTALSDSFVLVESRRSEFYLLTMFSGCIGLEGSLRIALISDLNRVCSNAAPSVGYDGIGGPETCPIVKIESVEDRESAERLVELRSNR